MVFKLIKKGSILFAFSVVTLCFFSCVGEEGKGGGATIMGQVIKRGYETNPIQQIFDSLTEEYPVIEERVYIEYGDDQIYSDDFKTDYDGWYKFDYLKKGTYRIYAYAKCDSCYEKVAPVFVDVVIDKNNDSKEAPVIYLDYDITD